MALSVLRTPKEKELDPYVGPRPFERNPDDRKRFFGRYQETEEILSLIFSHPLVLFYAQSGAGKTSIFNANVIPALEDHGLQVLQVARVGTYTADGSSTLPTKDSPLVNQYVFNLLQSLKQKVPSKKLTNKSIKEFLNEYFPPARDERGNVNPQVIIVDQLEELFNLYPNNKWREAAGRILSADC